MTITKHKIADVLLILLLIFSCLFFLYHVVSGTRTIAFKLRQNELQARVLMDEIGQTKQENNLLFQRLLESQKQVDALALSLKELKPGGRTAASPAQQRLPVRAPQVKLPQPKFLVQADLKPSVAVHTKNFLIVGHNMKLADTIMIAAVDASSQKITLISLPRDLYVNGRKVNEYLSLYGMETLRQKVAEVTGLAIDEYVLLDFGAFEKVIDSLGGIDMYVDKAIYDRAYPDGKGGIFTYAIEAGSHHMNGEQALKYARSRHSSSDFDRAKRQQQIVRAVHERVLNFDFLNHLDSLRALYDALSKSVATTVSPLDVIKYLDDYQNFAVEEGAVLSTANFLYSTYNVSGQYILLPQGGSFSNIQKYLRQILTAKAPS